MRSTCVAIAACMVAGCGDDGPAFDCTAHPNATLCITFDEPGQDVSPFGFSMFDGQAVTVADSDGLALRIDHTAIGTVGSSTPPATDLIFRFDMKTTTGTERRFGDLVLTPVALMQFDLVSTAAGKTLRLYAETAPGKMMLLTPPMPITLGDWTTFELRLSVANGQVGIEYSAWPRGGAPSNGVEATMAASSMPLTSSSLQLGAQQLTAMPDTAFFDNILFGPAL